MAKKKKKTRRSGQSAPKKDSAFNAPFAGLKKALKDAPIAELAPPPPPAAKPQPQIDEGELFARAMSDVSRMSPAKKDRVPQAVQKAPRLDLEVDDDLEVMAHLADLVAGVGEFDLRHSDQYVRGAVDGVGPELMERLMAGAFPIQDYLDMHFLSADQALSAVEKFLIACSTKGLRHVLLVTGKGQGSPGGIPVLKNILARALRAKRLSKRVLAFCTAQPTDGGAGALYILLRKWSGPKAGRW